MSTTSRRTQEKENRKQAILDAAEKIMKQGGLHSLNVDLIAAETQLAKGTIYLYFSSKEEIMAGITTKARNLLYHEFKAIYTKELPIIDKIKLLIHANFLFSIKHPLYYDLVSLYEANHLLEESGALYKSSEEITELVHDMFLTAKNENLLRDELDPMIVTMNAWATTVGTLQMIKVRGKLIEDVFKISNLDLFNAHVDLFIHGILK